jgi:citrate synthase
MNTIVNRGLEGVVAAETALSMVDGERGELLIAGYPVGELAPRATFEETVALLWPAPPERLAARRALPEATLALLRSAAAERLDPMDALRMSLRGATGHDADDAADVLARFPTAVAAYWRMLHGLEPVAPRTDLAHAENYLYMLNGQAPAPELVRGLQTYLNTVVDHGLNASTFTARVIVSTASDFVSAIAGALGALKGPLHGGAPGPALDMVFEIGEASRAETYLRAKLARGEKLMGFGHRVYKVRDPRAEVLGAAAERMFRRGGDMKLYELARAVEAVALRLLREAKPGRVLQTNVEFYTALLLHGLGLDTRLFTPTFAVGRVAGWLAHAFEQRRANRIIRPQSLYVGPRHAGTPVTARIGHRAHLT